MKTSIKIVTVFTVIFMVKSMPRTIAQDAPDTGRTVSKQSLSGPRMGIAYISGDLGRRLQDPAEYGGYDAYPLLTQFGYQWETLYMSSGNFQALLEYVPMISGLDQGLFIPSFTFLNGFRNKATGWEISFGPTLSVRKRADGFFAPDENGKDTWHLWEEWGDRPESRDSSGYLLRNPYKKLERLDKRGLPGFATGWVWTIGKTFRSGQLNIPVNAFVAPSKEGWYVGLSMGFNIYNSK